MHIELDIDLISNAKRPPFLLSIGYGNGHVVVEVDGEAAIEEMLTFIADHRTDKASCWMEIGHFASCSVTLTLSSDLISIVVGTDISAGSFGQSAGIYIPKDLLDTFVAGLKTAKEKVSDHGNK